MTTEDIKKVRALAGDKTIQIYCDNGFSYFDGKKIKESYLVWDDTKEMIHMFRTNNSFPSQGAYPIEVVTVPYEHIQMITYKASAAEALENLKTLGVTGEELVRVKGLDLFK